MTFCWGLLVAVAMVGCSQPPQAPAVRADQPPALPAKVLLRLEELSPSIDKPINPPDADKLPDMLAEEVTEAEKKMSARDFVGAVNLLERASGFDPNNPRIRRDLGLAYAGLSNRSKAMENLKLAAAAVPDDLEVQLALGLLLGGQKQTGQAAVALRRALYCTAAKAENPLAAESLLALGKLLQNEGYWQASLDCFTKLADWIDQHGRNYATRALLRHLVLRPERLLTRRGELLLLLNRPADAVVLLERSYRRNRTDRATARGLMAALVGTGDLGRAEKQLMELASEPNQTGQLPRLVKLLIRYVSKKTDGEQAMLFLGRLLCAERSFAASIPSGIEEILHFGQGRHLQQRLDEIIKSDPAVLGNGNEYALYYVAGQLAQLRGRNLLAAELYSQAIVSDSHFFPAYEALIDVLLLRKQWELVDRVVTDAVAAAGRGHFAYYIRGKVALARGYTGAATAALALAGDRDRTDVPTLLLLAEAYAKASRKNEVAVALLTAMRLDPDQPQIYRRLFDYYIAWGNYKQAEAVVGRLLGQHRDSIPGRVMLAELQLLSGRREQSAKQLAELKKTAGEDIDVQMLAIRLEMAGRGKTLPPEVFDLAVGQLSAIILRHRDNPRAWRMLAELLAMPGKGDRAVEVWGGLYEQTSRQADVGRAYAASLIRAEQHARAIDVLEELIEENPGDLSIRLRLLDVLEKLKRFESAIDQANRWLSEAEGQVLVSLYRSRLLWLYRQGQRYDDAQRLLDEWIDSKPAKPILSNLRSDKIRFFSLAGQHDLAVDYARSWIAESPVDPHPKKLIIAVLLDAKLYDVAQSLLDEWLAVEKAPAEELRLMKLQIFGRAERLDDVEEYALAWIAESPDSTMPRTVLLALLTEAENYDRAMTLVDAWLAELSSARRPQTAPAASAPATAPATRPAKTTELVEALKLWAIQLLLARQEYEQVIERVEQYIAGGVDNPQLYNLKFHALTELDRRMEAVAALEDAVTRWPEDVGLNNNLGYAYADLGIKLDKAERMVRSALAVRAKEPAFLDSLGWVFYKQGRFREAAMVFEQLLEKARDDQMGNALMYDHAGDVFYRLGRTQKAVDFWQKAIELAGKEKFVMEETRSVLDRTPDKLQAVKENLAPKLPPLGENVKLK